MSNTAKFCFIIIALIFLSIVGWLNYLVKCNAYFSLQNQRHSAYETGYIDGQKDYAGGFIVIQKTTRTEWTTTQPVINPFIKRDK